MRLSLKTLDQLPAAISRPGYDPRHARSGILHLGLGAFCRSHMVVYTDNALASGDLGWAITGASLRAPDTRDALLPQDGLYTLAAGDSLRVIGAIRDILVAPEDPTQLLARLSDPAIKIVSLTVTEKGYCHDPATGELNPDHPDIRHDLANSQQPSSAPGLIVRALARRREQGTAPFTVMTCDNLPNNGHTVRKVVTGLARLMDKDLAAFIGSGAVAFPASMVDRIVPATTDADRDRIRTALGGIEDAWPVITEPFSQWVIEDHFPSGRPDWAAQFTTDLPAWEAMKLRLLNGSHSTLAYLGYLAGHETVADAMANADLAKIVRRLMDEEVTPVLKVPKGADVESYKRELITRFHNPALRHRTWQIAMDGSQKLPQRLLGTIRDRLAIGAPIPLLALGVAAWMRYVTGIDEAGKPIDVRDPLAAELRRRADAAGRDPAALASALLSMTQIFGTDLPANPKFTGPVTAALQALYTDGTRATLASAAKGA